MKGAITLLKCWDAIKYFCMDTRETLACNETFLVILKNCLVANSKRDENCIANNRECKTIL